MMLEFFRINCSTIWEGVSADLLCFIEEEKEEDDD